jgi:hypothetical protein
MMFGVRQNEGAAFNETVDNGFNQPVILKQLTAIPMDCGFFYLIQKQFRKENLMMK